MCSAASKSCELRLSGGVWWDGEVLEPESLVGLIRSGVVWFTGTV